MRHLPILALLLFLPGCVVASLSLPKDVYDDRVPLQENEALAGRYEGFDDRGSAFVNDLDGLCPDLARADSSEVLPSTSDADSSSARAPIDSSAVWLEVEPTGSERVAVTFYCRGENVETRQLSGDITEEGYFKEGIRFNAGTKWYLLPVGLWVLSASKRQMGLNDQGDLIWIQSSSGLILLGFVFPIFGADSGDVGLYRRIEQTP